MSPSVTDPDHDLTEVVRRFQVRVGFARLIEGEDPIDRRPNPRGCDEPIQILQHHPTSHDDANQALGCHHELEQIGVTL